MIFCFGTLHLWGHIVGKFAEIKDLTYSDDDNIIVKLSTVFKVISILVPVFKKDVNYTNLDFNISKSSLRGPGQTSRRLQHQYRGRTNEV